MSSNPSQAAAPAKRRRNSDRTRGDILEVATKEFADKGYAGARVDVIAERTHATKRMIYYYFTDKEGLYQAVLEKAYGEIRSQEALWTSRDSTRWPRSARWPS